MRCIFLWPQKICSLFDHAQFLVMLFIFKIIYFHVNNITEIFKFVNFSISGYWGIPVPPWMLRLLPMYISHSTWRKILDYRGIPIILSKVSYLKFCYSENKGLQTSQMKLMFDKFVWPTDKIKINCYECVYVCVCFFIICSYILM